MESEELLSTVLDLVEQTPSKVSPYLPSLCLDFRDIVPLEAIPLGIDASRLNLGIADSPTQ